MNAAAYPALWIGSTGFAGAPQRIPLHALPHLLVIGASGVGKTHYLREALDDLSSWGATPDLSLVVVSADATAYESLKEGGLLRASVASDPQEAGALLHWTRAELYRRTHGTRGWLSPPEGMIAAGSDTSNSLIARPPMVVVLDGLREVLQDVPHARRIVADIGRWGRLAGVHLVATAQDLGGTLAPDGVVRYFPSRLVMRLTRPRDSRMLVGSDAALRLDAGREALFVGLEEDTPQPLFVGRSIHTQREGEFDPLIEQAAQLVRLEGELTRTGLMRLLHVGYGRAARIIDQLGWLGILRDVEGASGRYAAEVDGPGIARLRRIVSRFGAHTKAD